MKSLKSLTHNYYAQIRKAAREKDRAERKKIVEEANAKFRRAILNGRSPINNLRKCWELMGKILEEIKTSEEPIVNKALLGVEYCKLGLQVAENKDVVATDLGFWAMDLFTNDGLTPEEVSKEVMALAEEAEALTEDPSAKINILEVAINKLAPENLLRSKLGIEKAREGLASFPDENAAKSLAIFAYKKAEMEKKSPEEIVAAVNEELDKSLKDKPSYRTAALEACCQNGEASKLLHALFRYEYFKSQLNGPSLNAALQMGVWAMAAAQIKIQNSPEDIVKEVRSKAIVMKDLNQRSAFLSGAVSKAETDAVLVPLRIDYNKLALKINPQNKDALKGFVCWSMEAVKLAGPRPEIPEFIEAGVKTIEEAGELCILPEFEAIKALPEPYQNEVRYALERKHLGREADDIRMEREKIKGLLGALDHREAEVLRRMKALMRAELGTPANPEEAATPERG